MDHSRWRALERPLSYPKYFRYTWEKIGKPQMEKLLAEVEAQLARILKKK